jgi:hypothetical protein
MRRSTIEIENNSIGITTMAEILTELKNHGLAAVVTIDSDKITMEIE